MRKGASAFLSLLPPLLSLPPQPTRARETRVRMEKMDKMRFKVRPPANKNGIK